MGRDLERGQVAARRWLQHARASFWICLLMDASTSISYVFLRNVLTAAHERPARTRYRWLHPPAIGTICWTTIGIAGAILIDVQHPPSPPGLSERQITQVLQF